MPLTAAELAIRGSQSGLLLTTFNMHVDIIISHVKYHK